MEEARIEKKYDARKWKKIMDTTQSNYANMIKRLSTKQKVSNFVLIYYSIFLIINTLTGKYFPQYFNLSLAEYFGVILSVVMLAYSLINNSSNYSVRIANIEESLNELKTIKRKLSDDNLQQCIDDYNDITDNTERREDIDFFITVKHLCKEFEINWFTKKHKNKRENIVKDDEKEVYDNQEKVVNGYISEINVLTEQGKLVCSTIWNIILFVVPILIFALCVITSTKGAELLEFVL